MNAPMRLQPTTTALYVCTWISLRCPDQQVALRSLKKWKPSRWR
jgi:hypothetical protein